MATELAPRTGLIGSRTVDRYDLPADLTFDEWRGIVGTLQIIDRAVKWWLGDALVFGERKFGQDHSAALPTLEEDPHGVSQAVLKQAAWMSATYPPGTRVPGLSWTHHRVVADLEPADRTALLEEAAEARLSTRDLVERVHEIKAQSKAIDAASTSVCTAEQPWQPTKDDLLPEHRSALERAALAADLDDPRGFTAGWLAALVHTQQEAAFAPGKWRD